MKKIDKNSQQIATNDMSVIINKFSNNNPGDFHIKTDSLQAAAHRLKPIWRQIKTELTTKQDKFIDDCESIADELSAIDFGLDTLLVTAEITEAPIKNPMSYSNESLEGISYPVFSYDETIDQQNLENQEALQEIFDNWLVEVEKKIVQIRAARKNMYAVLGPEGKSSQLYSGIMEPILTSNSQFMNQLNAINSAFGDLYQKYNNMVAPWDLDDAMGWWATNELHRAQ